MKTSFILYPSSTPTPLLHPSNPPPPSLQPPSQVEVVFKPHACVDPEPVARLGETSTRYIKTKVSGGIRHIPG